MAPRHVQARPTHFLAFPIMNPSCQARSREVVDLLLKAKPRPDGVDESIAGSPRSLHLTLGIMALTTDKGGVTARSDGGSKLLHTVEDAAKLLRDCQAGLRELLDEEYIKQIVINLNRLESFQSDPRKCRVLYAEPEKGSPGVEILHQLAAYVRERFHNEGMLADYKQPLTLHCTLMKASARKNWPRKQVRPTELPDKERKSTRRQEDAKEADTTPDSDFDGTEAPNPVLEAAGVGIIGEQAIGSLQSKPQVPDTNKSKRKHKGHRKGVPKNYPFDASIVLDADPPHSLGETLIDSIHLYQMGKKDASGAYIILEEIKLFD